MRAANIVDTLRLVRVLEAIENGQRPTPGGRLCWTKAAWQETTRAPYVNAWIPAVSRAVANVRLCILSERFRQLGINPTVVLLSGAWKQGFDGAVRLHRCHLTTDYQHRAENLYLDPTFLN